MCGSYERSVVFEEPEKYKLKKAPLKLDGTEKLENTCQKRRGECFYLFELLRSFIVKALRWS